jgi:hypothetical protein
MVTTLKDANSLAALMEKAKTGRSRNDIATAVVVGFILSLLVFTLLWLYDYYSLNVAPIVSVGYFLSDLPKNIPLALGAWYSLGVWATFVVGAILSMIFTAKYLHSSTGFPHEQKSSLLERFGIYIVIVISLTVAVGVAMYMGNMIFRFLGPSVSTPIFPPSVSTPIFPPFLLLAPFILYHSLTASVLAIMLTAGCLRGEVLLTNRHTICILFALSAFFPLCLLLVFKFGLTNAWNCGVGFLALAALSFLVVSKVIGVGEMAPKRYECIKRGVLVGFTIPLWWLVGPLFLIVKFHHIRPKKVEPVEPPEVVESQEDWKKWRDKTLEGELA